MMSGVFCYVSVLNFQGADLLKHIIPVGRTNPPHDFRSGVSRFNSETSHTCHSYIINLSKNKFQEKI